MSAPNNAASWFAQNATPLEPDVDGESDDADLEPLSEILAGVRLVGLGEATHGTKEFIDARFRMLRHLVTRLDFNVVAIEASFSAAQRMNEYIVNGAGDLEESLTFLGSVMWDTYDFKDVLLWLRRHNEVVGEDRKVRFWGLDIYNTRPGRNKVLAYLGRAAPELVSTAAQTFDEVEVGEAKGFLGAYRLISPDLAARVEDLTRTIGRARAESNGPDSDDEYEDTLMQTRVVSQWLKANLPHDSQSGKRTHGLNIWARSRYMADNLAALMAHAGRPSKVMIWAHNLHVRVGLWDPNNGILVANMGHDLRERWGHEYYALAFELNQGRYLARTWLVEDLALGDFLIGEVPVAPEGSLPWHLSQTQLKGLMVDLRSTAKPAEVTTWLLQPQLAHDIGWARGDPPLLYSSLPIGAVYDGLVFFETTAATTPTPNAVQTVLNRTAN